MALNLWFWDGSAWRSVTNAWFWDGSAWRAVTGAWVWDGSAWRAAALPVLDAPTLTATWVHVDLPVLDAPTLQAVWNPTEPGALDAPTLGLEWVHVDETVLDAPTLSAEWNDVAGHMEITVTGGANNPVDTEYIITATGSGTGGSITGAGTFIDDVNPEDGSLSAYTAIARHASFQDSAASAEVSARRGVFGKIDTPSLSAAWNSGTNQVDVTITPGANTPSGTTYHVLRRWEGDISPAIQIGTTTTTTFHDGTATETSAPYAYSVFARASNWDDSDTSAEDTALVGA